MKWSIFQPIIKIVEVEKAQRVPAMDEGVAQSIRTLQAHPGFQYLLAKLAYQRQSLRSTLDFNRQSTMEDVILLQSGIAWSGWLKNELDKAIDFKSQASSPSTAEQTIFEESQRQLEVLR